MPQMSPLNWATSVMFLLYLLLISKAALPSLYSMPSSLNKGTHTLNKKWTW